MSETDVGLPALPDGWAWTILEDCTEILDSQRVPINAKEREKRIQGKSRSELYPYYGATGQTGWIDDYLFDNELVLLGEDGAPFLDFSKDKAYLIKGKSWVNNHAHVLRAQTELMSNQLLCHYLNIYDYHDYVTGTTRLKLNQSMMRKIHVPLPPLPEQHRIVAKIEELFTKLDAGINELHKAQSQLKRYRQSVLKAAFEGKLTEAWRVEHQDKIEPAFVLLERILKERREKWEIEQLEQMKAKGEMPKDDRWKAKYKEPIAPDTSNLPELSNGWKWVKLGQVTYLITKGSSPRWQGFNYVDKGIFFLRSQNVGWGGLNLSNIAYLPEAFNEKEKKSVLQRGDVLLNLVGASIGRAAIASDELEGANMNQAVALIRLVRNGLDNKFLMTYLISPDAQSIIHEKKVDVARANLSLTDVSEFAVPLPPLSEQQAIVSEVESRLSIADEVEKTITVELKRAEQLRQSILKKAFSGKLVPQDPNDEPASVLLERIKAKKSEHTQGKLMLNV